METGLAPSPKPPAVHDPGHYELPRIANLRAKFESVVSAFVRKGRRFAARAVIARSPMLFACCTLPECTVCDTVSVKDAFGVFPHEYRSGAGDRRAIGQDLARAQWRWPAGMPLCRAMGQGLWEVRTRLAGRRQARVLICHCNGELWALHAFEKKTRKTPKADLDVATSRHKLVLSP
jgi:phage-related protein